MATIRPMKDLDIEAVQEVAVSSWNTTYEGIIPLKVQESFLKYAYSENMLKKRLASSLLYVAEADGQVVGFINLSPMNDGGEAELIAIYLKPQFQGQGIGTALLHKGISELKHLNGLTVTVEKENQTGLAFYKAKGFQVLEEFEEVFNGHTMNSLKMTLDLTSGKPLSGARV